MEGVFSGWGWAVGKVGGGRGGLRAGEVWRAGGVRQGVGCGVLASGGEGWYWRSIGAEGQWLGW